MSEWGWVLGAFGLTWAVLIAYAIYLNVRLDRARRTFARATEMEEVSS